MRWSGAAAALMLAAPAFGDVVTITEYPSVCSAVYTTGSRSVTVVQSTVTVQPQPWTDEGANAGLPFVIEVDWEDLGSYKKRQEAQIAYLLANGNTTTNGSKAARWQIRDGQLSSGDQFVSTSPGIQHESFAVASTIEAISRTFAVQNSIFYWNNSAFDGNTAEFYKWPAGVFDNAQVVARFSGPIDPDWARIVLSAAPGKIKLLPVFLRASLTDHSDFGRTARIRERIAVYICRDRNCHQWQHSTSDFDWTKYRSSTGLLRDFLGSELSSTGDFSS